LATAVIDRITTHYEIRGSGVPLLMFSPGGFDATLDKWTTLGVYARIKVLEHLSRKYRCIVFDRRETGQSGGRVERVTWAHYVEQGYGLLRHLNIDRAHIMGGCMGCSAAVAFGVAHPETTLSLLLWWPVGGARYRINGHLRFGEHLAYVKQHGLDEVTALARSSDKSFGQDPRGGPWVSVLRRDSEFAGSYVRQDVDRYMQLVAGMGRTLFDRDTAPGAEPEDLLDLDIPALIVPGRDATHATSAARYLEECLPQAEYWDVPVDGQTEPNAPARLLAFLDSIGSPRSGSS
jgi:pimeloyl-ACP methyl ester carboxylesterase